MFLRRTPKPATTLHERFEQQVELRPRAIALQSDGVCLTYRELNEDANRMARRLVAAKVEADGLVLVAMERSYELVVTLLAVMKAGGAFVILDKTLAPAQRDAFVQASGADIVVTDTARPFPCKRVRPLRYYAASGLETNLDQRTQADRWACMIAGKVRSHEAVLQALDASSAEHRFQAGDGMFSAADFAGHAVIDLFLPLIVGGRLVVASPAEVRSVDTIDTALQAANCKMVRLPKTQPLSEVPQKTSAAHA
ncbi:MAG: AMP-binding protein [Bryobacteraceae bacterium]